MLNPQFYQLPLDVVQEFGVNEHVLETTVSNPVNNQVSLYINYDDLQTLNTNIYGQFLTQTPQLKLQVIHYNCFSLIFLFLSFFFLE